MKNNTNAMALVMDHIKSPNCHLCGSLLMGSFLYFLGHKE